MPLRESPLPIQFSGGVETKQDSKQIPTTRLIDLQNCTFIKQTTLAKRNGYRALGKSVDVLNANYGTGVGLATRNDELILFDGQRALSHRSSSDTWSNAGDASSITASDVSLGRSGTQQTNSDHATNGGVTVVAWEDSRGGVWASVVEASSGRILKAEAQVAATGNSPRVIACGTVLHLLYALTATTQMFVVVVNPAAPANAFVPQLLTDDLEPLGLVTGPGYDACTLGGGLFPDIGPGLIVWVRVLASGGGFRVGYIHPSGVLGSPVTGLPSVATFADTIDGAIACSYDKAHATAIAVLWTNNPTAKVRFLNPSTLATIGADFSDGTTGSATRCTCEFGGLTGVLGSLWWAVEKAGAGTDKNLITTGCAGSDGSTLTASRVLRGHGLQSRAFHDNDDVYATVGHGVKFFPYAATIRLSAASLGGTQGTRAFGRFLPGLSNGLPTRCTIASSNPVSPTSLFLSRQHAMNLGFRIQLSSKNGDQFGEAGIRLTSLNFADNAAYQPAQLGQGLYLSGACISHYDGSRWAEAGFHCAPDTASGVITTLTGGGGGMTAGQKYLYIVCYEEIDASGELHQGPASAPITVTLGGGDGNCSLTIPTLRLTNRKHVRIGVYRSAGNATGTIDQIQFFRVTSTDPSSSVGNNRYIPNDATVDSVSFTDAIADTQLTTLEPLYTNGGVLSNDPTASAGTVLGGGKNRLFYTDPSDPHLVRFTQERADETAAEFAAPLSARKDPYGGRIVGIGILDDAVAIFAETAVYIMGGPGPAPAPALSDNAFTPPELLTSDVGCKSPRSICQTPVGIVFQSEKGIMLLGRDRQIQDIGRGVYVYNNQTIVRATLLPDRHQIVFLTNAGRTLLYDYHPDIQQWSTYTNHEGIDAVVVTGTYNYLRTDGRVFVETPGLYKDDNQHIPMLIETAWIKLSGYLQGWQSILWALFLGTYLSEHTLRVRYRINYQEAYTAPIDMNVNSNYNPSLYGAGLYGAGAYGGPGGPSTVYQRGVHLNRDCQSISFRIQDVEATTSFGAAFQLSELLLIGGVLAPDFKVGAART